ncbi:hypothetical protein B7463_g11014, partial [Scytalidium lignicola]
MSIRKRKADDDAVDESMSVSPQNSPAISTRNIARPSKKARANEVTGRPLSLPRLLETLDAQSLRAVLQAICERHPDIGREVVTSAPRPSVASTLDVLTRYQQKLRDAFPFGGNPQSDYAYNRVKQALTELVDAILDFTPHYLPPNESQVATSLSFLDGVTKVIHDLPNWDSHSHRHHKDNTYDEISKAWALVISESSKRGGGFQLHSGGWDQKLTKHNEQSGGRMQIAVNALGNLGWMDGSSSMGPNDPTSIRNQLLSGSYGANVPVHVGCSGGRTITNPFEEVKPRISEYTAQEIATLQSRLEKQLGPEYISSRAGPSGQKVHYLAAEKCIQLANEIFGFNGWSSQIMDIQVDFVDENPNTFKVSLGLSVIVRVTLRDGTFHEDIGYGHIENCKGKAAAFEKAKKEGTTDALKRALRNFGNVLGNCIYDKEYLSKVTKVKVQPTKWDVDNLHRHSTHAPPPPVKKEPDTSNSREDKGNEIPSLLSEDTFDDEFGDFDDADFSVPQDPDSHPDEVILAPTTSNDSRSSKAPLTNTNQRNHNQPLANPPQVITVPSRIQTGIQAADRSRGSSVPPQQPPQTPNKGFSRSVSGSGVQIRPPNETGPPRNVHPLQNGIGRVLNQPSRIAAEAAVTTGDEPSSDKTLLPPPGAGFFSARAAANLTESSSGNNDTAPKIPTANLPAFNPHAESPSIRKTPGVDHNTSKPIGKDLLSRPSQTPSGTIPPRPNIFNPQLDTNRKIGVPGSPSVLTNRGQYRPPTFKRPIESTNSTSNSNRTPLVDLPTNGMIVDGGGDVKRQKVNG